MQYIIMDLEWNNVYYKKTEGFINEIIEVGAVKIDESLDVVDTFSCLVRSQVGQRLRGRVKTLTHLTYDEVQTGLPFTKAFSLFKEWIGQEDTVLLTWGDTDIRVLLENFIYFGSIDYIPFLTKYCDAQSVYQNLSENFTGQQVGLTTAAVELGIDPETYSHHRALDDSLLTSEIFEIIFNKKQLEKETVVCNEEYYKRLLFKPKLIKSADNPCVDKKKLEHYCDFCGTKCKRTVQWKLKHQYLNANFTCPSCKNKFVVKIRIKKTYDGIEYKKIVSTIDKQGGIDE